MDQLFSLLIMLLMQLLSPAADAPSAPDEVVDTEPAYATVLSVTDGDTIVVDIDGARETVRYIGIDTPEPYRDGEPACYSTQATERNRALVAGQTVRLEPDAEDRDRFDRLLRYVYVEDQMINELLVAEGYATTLTIKPNTSFAEQFAQLERAARTDQLGLWGVCQ